ncbi:MAG: L,D-transpeptidase [Patescibacteria group bacterium]|jgi:hypothetical protein|nr:L,D-transpeptidase [Patescibacteria group bacterium]
MIKNKFTLIAIFVLFFLFASSNSVLAEEKILDPFLLKAWDTFYNNNKDEYNFGLDFDGDGYSNRLEIRNAYSPFNKEKINIHESDVDDDGLSDYWEIVFQTNPFEKDSDGDSYNDFIEIDNLYSPLNSSSNEKLDVKIEINLEDQELYFLVEGYRWKNFSVSTGKPSTPTTPGVYEVVNKFENAWSASYGLWMPYWLGLDRGRIGIHELPVWPNGYREGEDHLGTPVSHGCIRLGVNSAKYVYERTNVGTTVDIY